MGSSNLARKLFVEAVRAPISLSDLTRIAVLISAEDDPETNISTTLSQLENLAATLDRSPVAVSGPEQLRLLSSHVHGTLGFRGNVEAYYDPRNSLLGQVLTRRLGIPLTLGLVYMDIAQHHGVGLVPIGLPGHLVLRHASDTDLYLDPFNGTVLTEHACLTQVLGEGYSKHSTEELLRPMQVHSFLRRMLTNLKVAYLHGEPPDLEHALTACERLLLLYPELPEEVRDRGLLRLQRGSFVDALHDLERYLELVPEASDFKLIQHYIRTLYTMVSSLN